MRFYAFRRPTGAGALQGVKGAPGSRSPHSPGASSGRAGTGEDAAQRTLDAHATCQADDGGGECFSPRALRLPGESGSAVDLDLAVALRPARADVYEESAATGINIVGHVFKKHRTPSKTGSLAFDLLHQYNVYQ